MDVMSPQQLYMHMLHTPEVKQSMGGHRDDDFEQLSARGPTTPCPVVACPVLGCQIFMRGPVQLLSLPCNLRCDGTYLDPRASNAARLMSLFVNIRRLSESVAPDVLMMQGFSDIPIVMPCVGLGCHLLFGEDVDLSPAAAGVMSHGMDTFRERGVWLYPRGQGRRGGSGWLGRDCSHRCSFCCCCCAGGLLGGCDGTLQPPLPCTNPYLIMYIHGGAFALSNAVTYPWLLGYELVRRTGAVVLVPDYARPPGATFGSQGSPIHDCLLLYERLLGHYDPQNIIVMGDSAGANIALAMLFAAGQKRLPNPAGLVLISPWADVSEGASLCSENADFDYLAIPLIRLFATAYSGTEDGYTNPFLCPLQAPADWFRQLPPTLLTYGTGEILRTQQQELQQKLDSAGVLRVSYAAPGMPHASPIFATAVWGTKMPTAAPLPPEVEALDRIQMFAASLGFEVSDHLSQGSSSISRETSTSCVCFERL